MAKRTKKDRTGIIIGVCCAVVVIIIVVAIAVALATSGNKLNDEYFVSDDTKYVLTVEASDLGLSDEEMEYAPLRVHEVYNYSGDEITGMKSYAEFADVASAQKAYSLMKESGEDMEGITIDGKYIVKVNPEEDYKDKKASEIKAYIDVMEPSENTDQDEEDATEEETVEQ